MLSVPSESGLTFNIIGIDPGSNMLGISVITVDIASMKIVSSFAWTVSGEKLAGKENFVEEIHGGRVNRILALELYLLQTFRFYQPYLISCESPFINNAFPQAGIALTEVLSGIRRAVMQYDCWKQLGLVPPSLVKNAVGAGGGTGKNTVKEAVLAITELNYSDGNIELLDEHSIDALAVAYARFKSLST